jgi:hypothetical protein
MDVWPGRRRPLDATAGEARTAGAADPTGTAGMTRTGTSAGPADRHKSARAIT